MSRIGVIASLVIAAMAGLLAAYLLRAPTHRTAGAEPAGSGRAAGRRATRTPTSAVSSEPEARSAIERDPRKPGYDAGRLYGASWTDAAGIFGAEPRQEPWATTRERELLGAIEADLLSVDPAARVSVECHTSSCKVRIESHSPMLVAELDQYPIVCSGLMVEPEFDPEAGLAEHVVIYGEANRSSEAFARYREAQCPTWREQWLRRRDRFLLDGTLD